MPSTLRSRVALIAVGAATLLTLTGCFGGGSPTAESTSSSRPSSTMEFSKTEEAEPEDASVFELEVGDCLTSAAMSSTTEVQSVPKVDCSAPHTYEVYYEFEMTETTYPGQSAIDAAAEKCIDSPYETFVGTAYNSSSLNVTYFYPTTESWAQGDREISCMIYESENDTTTGSLADSRK